jgi:hypothetical protein
VSDLAIPAMTQTRPGLVLVVEVDLVPDLAAVAAAGELHGR